MKFRNMFANRTSGALCRVDRVDASYATLSILTPSQSKYMMPIKEYDTLFVRSWRPAELSDLEALGDSEGFRYPANAPLEWTS